MSDRLNAAGAVPRPVRTVLGEISHEELGITDAHSHVWIDPVPSGDFQAPVLNRYSEIRAELQLYRAAGGAAMLDCQPQGCGRNANQLVSLSEESGVHMLACTGFHRKKYYPPTHPLFDKTAQQAADFFIEELTESLVETRNQARQVRAGFIKIALEKNWADCPLSAVEGAAGAAKATGALVEIHTERGALAEKAVLYFESQGVSPHQLVLCHMDKRPIPSLHIELTRYGLLLEYDTFYRSKYSPETNLWPLISAMLGAGLSSSLAFANDIVEYDLFRVNGGPGLASLPADIYSRLKMLDIPENLIRQMLGGNIARRLAGFTH